ncbi:MAG: hypothetical protein HC764_08495 [Pleurocapsa sp. CRU_1_2]|nr:hypothetical protein [Pleurocapsa sp. CRU_1_2]
MRFISTKFNNPCPICQDTSGDCRTTPDNLIILCHSFIDLDSGVAGFKWTKASSNGVWGVHILDQGKDFNREQYERYLAQKEALKRNKKQFLADNALDTDGRDRAIRKLARHIGLSDRHRQDLKNRGLSDRAIEAGLFFSIDPWIRFNLNLPENLPGIHYKGDCFATRDSGYACVIFDVQGRAIGWQLRVDEVTKGNKYKWAKGTFSSHLPNGELPITVIKPNENALKTPDPYRSCLDTARGSAFRTLYLSEGILKPYIASYLHDIPICGAAGGHFKGSPEQLTEIVSDYEELAIAPDGGDVLNPQVMRRWEQQINFLKRFNKLIKIIWWGQVKKSDGDLDEIDWETFSKAEHLTPKEFFDLAKKQQYIQQQWDNWRNYKKFTPQIKIEKKFVEFGLPQTNTITLIKSGLGTGKTTETIKHLHQLQKYGIIGLGYRNTLLLQFNEKAKSIGFYHLQSDKNLREFSLDNPSVKVTNCVDSLIYYVKEQFDDKIIIIDEIISVLKHFLFSPTIKQFSKIKELFTEMANRCDRLICLDGFMQDWAVTFFKELCPDKQIITIENIYQGNKAKVYLLEGTIDIDEKIRANDRMPWVEKLLNSDCPAIASDSQVFCEAIEKLLQEQGRSGIRVDSKTVCEDRVKEFFTDPDKWIQKNQPEYVIYSPSAESGLDIPTQNYFNSHFAFFFGQLDVDSMIQMLGRIRDVNVPKYVWCKKFIAPEDTSRRPSNLESIQADRQRSLMDELNLIIQNMPNLSKEQISSRIQQIHQSNLDPYTTAADTIGTIRNHEFSNYRECLKRQLIDSGYPVETVTLERLDDDRAIAALEKEAKTDVKKHNSKDIYNASDKYIGQKQANLSFDADWQTRCAVIKAQLVNRLPGINHDSVWSPEFIKLVKYDKPNLISQTRLYYLIENPELAKQLSLEKYNNIFNRGAIAAPWKLRQDYLKVKALRDIGLYDFVQTAIDHPDFIYTADSPEVIAIVNKCQQRKHKNILGTPGKDSIKFINKLLRSVGIQVKTKRRKKNGRSYSVYSIDQDFLLSEERLAILQALQLKYEDKNNSHHKPLEWVTDDQNSPQNSPLQKPLSKMAENTNIQGLEMVTDSTSFYINNSTKYHPSNNQLLTANSTIETNYTNKLQNSLDSEEAIIDLAEYLDVCESAEDLKELQQGSNEITKQRLNRACRLLPLKQQRLIRQWAIKNQKRSTF